MNSVIEKIRPIVKDQFVERDPYIYFTDAQTEKYAPAFASEINRLKTWLKRWPQFYEFLRFFSPGVSGFPFTARKALRRVFPDNLADKVIINIGSGPRVIHPEVVNLDIWPLPNVHLIANAERLPFTDSSIDMVICESLLEHVKTSTKVITEISRVVKPGGYVYIVVPFLYPYHDSPSDYYRWTTNGLIQEFAQFETIRTGVYAGPSAVLQGVLMHLLALPLSLGNNRLYIFWTNFLRFLLSPIKILDILLNFLPKAHEVAAMIFFFGRKI